MEKRILFFALLLNFAGKAQVIREDVNNDGSTDFRQISNYQSVSVTDGIELHITQGADNTVKIIASTSDYKDKIKTVVQGNTLKVYFDYKDDKNWKGLINSKERFKVFISVPSIDKLTASNGSSVIFDSYFHSNHKMYADFSAGGKLIGKISLPSASIELRGGATASLSGIVESFTIRALEGSEFNGTDLNAQSCSAFSSSASKIIVSVNKSLEAEAINKASIEFKGNATVAKVEKQDGKVSKIDL